MSDTRRESRKTNIAPHYGRDDRKKESPLQFLERVRKRTTLPIVEQLQRQPQYAHSSPTLRFTKRGDSCATSREGKSAGRGC